MSAYPLPEARGRLALFPEAEFTARAERARQVMATAGIDALWLTSETNHVYFSGLNTPSFVTRARPITMILPASGEPVVIVSRNQEGQARAASFVPDIRIHTGLESEALAVTADVLRERGLAAARIGCELGEEQRLGLSYLGFETLRARLPQAHWVDAAAVLWQVRSIKSEREIAYLREIGGITGRAYEHMLAAARPGIRESEVHAALVASLVAQGADSPRYGAIHSGPGNYRRIGGPTDRRLAPGDLLWADTGVSRKGYWADYTRTLSIGRPSQEHQRLYAVAHEACQAMLAAVRPGLPIAELMRVCRRIFAREGLELGAATRVGHGIGADLAEPPSVVDANETPLAVGMTLAIEPAVARDDGFLGVEENFVVTAKGADLLSAASPASLPWIDA
ncbi:MAG: M24 family metallopeptidase [Parvibaculaceae bacterium]